MSNTGGALYSKESTNHCNNLKCNVTLTITVELKEIWTLGLHLSLWRKTCLKIMFVKLCKVSYQSYV